MQESQSQSQRNKDKAQEVLRNHKKKERELVKQGKKAYHIKARKLHPMSFAGGLFVLIRRR